MPVPAVTPAGRLTLSAGSTSATHDAMLGVPPTLNFTFRSGSVITAQSVTSLPVPAVVGAPTSGGVRGGIRAFPHSYRAMLPPMTATTPIPLPAAGGPPPPLTPRPPPPAPWYEPGPAP